MGVIDALSAGFRIVGRRLWLILIPVALDLYLWLGPKISIAPLLERFEAVLMSQAPAVLSGSDAQALDVSRDMLTEMGRSFNLFSVLVNSLLGVPSLMAVSPEGLPMAGSDVLEVSSGFTAFGLFILFLLCSVWIASLYLGLIAQQVCEGHVNLLALARNVWSLWARIVGLGLLLIALFVAFFLPLSLISALFALVSQGLAVMMIGVFTLFAFSVAAIVMLYLYYSIGAMLINNAGILAAVRNSIVVVRQNLWSTIGLILLTMIIGTGLSLIWQQLTFASWGVIVGILGNAYIGSSLMAAVLVFYLDRYNRWQESLGGKPQGSSPVSSRP